MDACGMTLSPGAASTAIRQVEDAVLKLYCSGYACDAMNGVEWACERWAHLTTKAEMRAFARRCATLSRSFARSKVCDEDPVVGRLYRAIALAAFAGARGMP